MKDNILNYDNREQLYSIVAKTLALKKIDEKYYPEVGGDFYVTLYKDGIFVRYSKDRPHLFVDIASDVEPDNWFPLLFIMNYINGDELNSIGINTYSNEAWLGIYNNFLEENFEKLKTLFNAQNYFTTASQIKSLLKESFEKRYNAGN